MNFWIATHPDSAARMVAVIREFGFATPEFEDRLFLEKGRIIRMGVEPLRMEILTRISGCDAWRVTMSAQPPPWLAITGSPSPPCC